MCECNILQRYIYTVITHGWNVTEQRKVIIIRSKFP